MSASNTAPTHSSTNYYLIIVFIAAFAGILFGYDTGVISGAILFITQKFALSPEAKGVVVSSVLFGALFGAIFSGRLSDLFGRKRLLVIDAIIFIVGTVIASLAHSIELLVIGRVIVGIAIGISSYIAPLYISEISPPKRRGALVSLNQLAITVGIFISYLVDYHYAGTENWRAMFMAGAIPALLLLIGMIFLPRSPRWLLSRGNEQETLMILRKIRGHEKLARDEFRQIKASLAKQQESSGKASWKMLFSKHVRPALLIAAGLAFLQQVTGVNTILYYAPTIFNMAGFHAATTAILATMGVGAIFVIFTVIALPLIDTLGRRPLLYIGTIAMTLSLGLLSLSFYLHADSSVLKWMSLISMVVFIAGFAISLGPIMWLMISEIFPLKVRGFGSSLATCVNWGSNWLVAITFPLLIESVSASGTFLIYAIIGLLTLFFIHHIVPETKGVTLEDIEKNLYAGKPARKLGK